MSDDDQAEDSPSSPPRDPYGFAPGVTDVEASPTGPTESTPLEHDESDHSIPAPVLWAMKDRRHHFLAGRFDEERIRAALGEGNSLIYSIDDGDKHCMIGRQLGSTNDGCEYCLVARVTAEQYADLTNGLLPVDEAFSIARDIELCEVYEADGAVSNVIPVQHYSHPRDIPTEYLPPNPPIKFSDV